MGKNDTIRRSMLFYCMAKSSKVRGVWSEISSTINKHVFEAYIHAPHCSLVFISFRSACMFSGVTNTFVSGIQLHLSVNIKYRLQVA